MTANKIAKYVLYAFSLLMIIWAVISVGNISANTALPGMTDNIWRWNLFVLLFPA